MRISRHVHGPQHVVIPGGGVADEQGVFHPPPVQAVFAHRVRDVVVIGKREVKEVVLSAVPDHVDVTDLRLSESVT